MNNSYLAINCNFKFNNNSNPNEFYSSSYNNSSSNNNNFDYNEVMKTADTTSHKNIKLNIPEIEDKEIKERNVNYIGRLICFKSENQYVIAYINNKIDDNNNINDEYKINFEKDNEKFDLKDENYILNINYFTYKNDIYIIYSLNNGQIKIYNFNKKTIELKKQFYEVNKAKNIFLCTIVNEDSIHIFGCHQNKIKQDTFKFECDFYDERIKNITEIESEVDEIYFIKSFLSKNNKNFIIISKKYNSNYILSSIEFEFLNEKEKYKDYSNNEIDKCYNIEIIFYDNKEILFACYQNLLIGFNFDNKEKIYEYSCGNHFYKVNAICNYNNEFIFVSGHEKSQKNKKEKISFIYLYNLEENQLIEKYTPTGMKIYCMQISNNYLVTYNGYEEIKKFEIKNE